MGRRRSDGGGDGVGEAAWGARSPVLWLPVSLLIKFGHFLDPGRCRSLAPGVEGGLDEAAGDAGREFLGPIDTFGFHAQESKKKNGGAMSPPVSVHGHEQRIHFPGPAGPESGFQETT
jgi:hypothetical protein